MIKKIKADKLRSHSSDPPDLPEPNPMANISSKLSEILNKIDSEPVNNEQLIKRMEEVRFIANSALTRLQSINKELCERASSDLFPHINQVIVPAITETSKIINAFDQALNDKEPIAMAPEEIIQQMSQLNAIYGKWKDIKSIENSVLDRVISKVSDIVKDTRKQVNNYKIYKLAETDEVLSDHIHAEIDNYIEKSFQEFENSFSELNKELDIKTVGKAVENIRHIRERIFDNNLEKIDELVPTTESAPKAEMERPILELEIKFIREEIKLVQSQLKILDRENVKSIEDLINYVESIQEQIEELIQYALPHEKEELIAMKSSMVVTRETYKVFNDDEEEENPESI